MSTLFLKMKLKSLMAEAAMLRKHEVKCLGRHTEVAKSLKCHRIGIIRSESRDSLIAYGFLRGKTYAQVEGIRYSEPDQKNIARMIVKYGHNVDKFDVEKFFKDAPKLAVHGPRLPKVRKSNWTPDQIAKAKGEPEAVAVAE